MLLLHYRSIFNFILEEYRQNIEKGKSFHDLIVSNNNKGNCIIMIVE